MLVKRIIVFVLFLALFISSAHAEINFKSQLVDAADKGNFNIVSKLIRQGYDINSKDLFGTTSLMRSVINNHYEVANILLDAGANPDLSDDGGATAMHIAARQGNIKLVKLLLNHNASVNIPDKKGWTPLMRALNSKNNEVFDALISAGADVNLKNNWGQTALVIATQSENVHAVEKLLLKNSKTEIQDNTGDKALDIAERVDSAPIEEMLKPIPKIKQIEKVSKQNLKGNYFLDFGQFSSDAEIKQWWENLSEPILTVVKGLELYIYMPKDNEEYNLNIYRARAGIIENRDKALEKCDILLAANQTCNIVEGDAQFTNTKSKITDSDKKEQLEEILPWLSNENAIETRDHKINANVINKNKYLDNINEMITQNEIAEAQKQSRDFVNNKDQNNDLDKAEFANNQSKGLFEKFYDNLITNEEESLDNYPKQNEIEIKKEINNISQDSDNNFAEIVNEKAINNTKINEEDLQLLAKNSIETLELNNANSNVEVMEAIPYVPDNNRMIAKSSHQTPRNGEVKLKESIWLQVGNFASSEEATHLWKTVSNQMNVSGVRVKIIEPNYYQKRRGKSKTFLRVGMFDYESDAKIACDKFNEHKQVMCNYVREVGDVRANGANSKIQLAKNASQSHTRYLNKFANIEPKLKPKFTSISEKRKNKNEIYWIHLGSYRNKEAANNYFNKIKNHYPKLMEEKEVDIQTIGDQTRHKLFNLRVGPFDKYEKAGDICNNLQSNYIKCVVM